MCKTGAILTLAVLSAAYANASHADEMCATKVQNNDRYGRAVDHLQVDTTGSAPGDDRVVVNRIIMPGPDNVTSIHWNCATHTHAYSITGMSADGREIVSGTASPTTFDVEFEKQPLTKLTTKIE